MKRKVCVVITARPSYARVKTALLALRDRQDVELQVVAIGSMVLDRYGSPVRIVEADGIPVADKVYMLLEGENLVTSAKSTGIALIELTSVFDRLRPDVVVTIGDRYETLATATAAAYMNIPLAHVQGGEVTGSIDEKVRHAVTKLANIHFVSTKLAAQRVIQMGEAPTTVHLTGCPSVDLAAKVAKGAPPDYDPVEKYGGVGANTRTNDGYILVMQHPVTTEYERAFAQATETLRAVRSANVPALWFWPNPDAGSDGTSKAIRTFRENSPHAPIHFFKNLSPEDFLQLASAARCIVGNSSVALRECSYLGVPAVNVGSREQGRERGHNVVDVPYEAGAIADAVRRQIEHGRYPSDALFGDGHAGDRIAKLLAELPLTIEKRLSY